MSLFPKKKWSIPLTESLVNNFEEFDVSPLGIRAAPRDVSKMAAE